MRRIWLFLAVAFSLAFGLASAEQRAADSLDWRVKQNQVDANIDNGTLLPLLKKIARATGWKVYVEPGAATTVSVKFKEVSQDEALRRLLGKLNYARDATNGVTRLLVFRTMAGAATQAVPVEKKDYRIHNEDLVKTQSMAPTPMPLINWRRNLGPRLQGGLTVLAFFAFNFPTPPAPTPRCKRWLPIPRFRRRTEIIRWIVHYRRR